jgi:excisionase family DNA binding protein
VASTRWLTAREAGEYARVSTATLRRAVRRGALRAFRVNNGFRVRFRAEDLDSWLAANPVPQQEATS